tara:strand:+ start:12761 stop:14092 length:1332 start_codon:yes stop_codon:yes gene_type:complete
MKVPEIHTKYELRGSGNNWYRGMSQADSTPGFFPSIGPNQETCIIKNELDSTIATNLYSKLYNGRDNGTQTFLSNNDSEGLVLDAYKHWNSSDKTVKVAPNKYWWHHILSKLDNHLLQKITNDKIGYSYLAANATLKIIEKLYKIHGDELQEKLEDLNQELKMGDPGCEGLNGDITRAVNSATNGLKKDIDSLENSKMAGKCNSSESLTYIDMSTDPRLKKLTSIKGGDLNKFLKTTIDRATATSTGKYSTTEESIFDADAIEELINVEAFAHVALVLDAVVRERKYHLSFDVYIDDSGSMDSRCKIGETDVSVTYRDLARMVAFKLFSLGILRDVYLFSCRDTITKIAHEHIFSAHIGGGTDIQQCISLARSQKRPAILITDGWDSISEDEEGYFKDMFILVLECTSTHHSFKQFLPKKQIMFYNDGKFMEAKQVDDRIEAV